MSELVLSVSVIISLVGQALLEQLQENPLRPSVKQK
jgi:hypothetical protein